MLTCKEITQLVTDYLEGRLSLWQRLMFRMHIGLCEHCHRYLQQMRVTIALEGAIPSDSPPPEVRDELLRRFRSWRK